MVFCSVVLFVLLLVPGIICETDATIDGTTEDGLTTIINYGTSTLVTDEDVSIKTSSTDVDTDGDIIITSRPENHTHKETTNATDTDVTEDITLSTVIDVSTPVDIITFPDDENNSACSSDPCLNNATCHEEPGNQYFYKCNCTHGYAGTHCQVTDKCVTDENGNLCNKGACAYEKDGLTRFCECYLGMFWDEAKKECRDPIPMCFPNPCHNNGTCNMEGENYKCDCHPGYEGSSCEIANWCPDGDTCFNGQCVLKEGIGKKECVCDAGFYWNEEEWECEVIEPPCNPNPCKNNGTCESFPNDTVSFNCTCQLGFLGPKCEIQNLCTLSTDGLQSCVNGICEIDDDSQSCSCNEGYYLEEKSQTCKEIEKPCVPNPCANYGVCYALSDEHYSCTCSDGYIGRDCEEMDYCVLEGGNGFCDEAECVNYPQLRLFYCSCEVGKYFDYTTRKCLDVDFCPLMKCAENEVCQNSVCQCDHNYEWNNSTEKCEPNFCSSNPCPVKDLICTQTPGTADYQCSCEEGSAFNGKHCKAGASCIFPSLNSCKQMCTISKKKAVCSCKEEYFELSADNKTCSPMFGNMTCSKKTCEMGTCVVGTENSEKCICPPGYTEVTGKCVDLCTAGRLPDGFCPRNQCEATKSGFRCKCEGKYALSEDKTTCTVRRLCQKTEKGWTTCTDRSAICVEDWNTVEGFRCQCKEGKVPSQDGYCQDICNKVENQKMCSELQAECVVSGSSPTCRCPPCFARFENGTVCNEAADISYTLSLPLNPDAYRISKEVIRRQRRSVGTENQVNYDLVQKDVNAAIGNFFPGLQQTQVLVCRENRNFILCKIEMQFSSLSEENLKRLKLSENCLTVKGSSSKCVLPPSLVLQKDFISEIVAYDETDPCDADVKDILCGSDTICTSSPTSFNCTCKAGFAARNKNFLFEDTENYVESCRDIDECREENACSQNMKCENTIGSYLCTCKSKYRIQDTSNLNSGCVEICNPNPCVHGECSATGDHEFECRCDAGYSGMLCNLKDEHFKRARTNTIIVGAVLGGALLVTLILTYVYVSRLKKKKYSDGPDQILYATEMTERRNVDSGTINNAFQREQ